MKIRTWTIASAVLFVVMGIMILRPVPVPDEKDCLSLAGTVSEITEAGTMDVVFQLKGVDKKFYINRGLERGLTLARLREDLIGRKIVIKYPRYWTPLDPANSVRHVSKLEYNGETVFSEID